MNTSTAEKRARSAKAPMIRLQVIAANAHWKAKKPSSGITTPLLKVAVTASGVRPFMNSRSVPPKKALPSVKAKL